MCLIFPLTGKSSLEKLKFVLLLNNLRFYLKILKTRKKNMVKFVDESRIKTNKNNIFHVLN